MAGVTDEAAAETAGTMGCESCARIEPGGAVELAGFEDKKPVQK